MKESFLVRDKFKEWESIGKMDVDKTNEELAQAWKLELVQTKEEMERLSKELLELNWTKFETATAGASYAGLSDLLKEHRRKTGLEEWCYKKVVLSNWRKARRYIPARLKGYMIERR